MCDLSNANFGVNKKIAIDIVKNLEYTYVDTLNKRNSYLEIRF
jgi:hypothetical protein